MKPIIGNGGCATCVNGSKKETEDPCKECFQTSTKDNWYPKWVWKVTDALR